MTVHSARRLLDFPLVALFSALFGAPLVAQSQPPYDEAETMNTVASTLPAIDIATQGDRIAVAWFAWDFNTPVSDLVITLFARDANGAFVEETVSQTHSAPTPFNHPFGGSGLYNGLVGPTLVDLTSDAVVSTYTTWSRSFLGGLYFITPDAIHVQRQVRQTDGSWLTEWLTPLFFGIGDRHAVDLVATDELVVLTGEQVIETFLPVVSRAVYALEPGTPAWTTKTVATYMPAKTGTPRVDTDGTTVVIGLEAGSGPTPHASGVELHRRDLSGTWQLEQRLKPSDSVTGDRFGCDVSLLGDRLAVAAVQPGTSTFVAYVFERTAGTTGPWVEVAKLVPPPPYAAPLGVPSGGLGYRKQSIVSLENGRVVVAHARSDVHAPGAGSADVYMRSPAGVWEHSVRLAPRAGTFRAFTSMDSDGERIVAAAWGSGPDQGTYDIYDFGSLLAVGDGPSLTTAAPQTLAIDEGTENAGDVYAILGSLTGSTPGLPVPGTPFVMPLVSDSYLEYTLITLGGGGVLSAPFGILDASGRATCDFTIPVGLPASFVGISIFHAAVIFDLHAVGAPATHVTNSVTSTLVP